MKSKKAAVTQNLEILAPSSGLTPVAALPNEESLRKCCELLAKELQTAHDALASRVVQCLSSLSRFEGNPSGTAAITDAIEARGHWVLDHLKNDLDALGPHFTVTHMTDRRSHQNLSLRLLDADQIMARLFSPVMELTIYLRKLGSAHRLSEGIGSTKAKIIKISAHYTKTELALKEREDIQAQAAHHKTANTLPSESSALLIEIESGQQELKKDQSVLAAEQGKLEQRQRWLLTRSWNHPSGTGLPGGEYHLSLHK